MRIYIAARYNKRYELLDFAKQIQELGHTLTCEWLFEGEVGKSCADAAKIDTQQVEDCDCLIFIGEAQGSRNTGGGRWFEMGLAWACGHRIIALLSSEIEEDGRVHLPPGHESVFTALDEVEVAESQEHVLQLLGEA